MDKIELSRASAEYLRPAKNLGDAVMFVTMANDNKHFIIEIYDEYTDKNGVTHSTSPYSTEACWFIQRRFKHGAKDATKQGIFHPRYRVPITDYSVFLIANAWTNRKIIDDLAKPHFNKVFLREFIAEQNAIRIAKWRENHDNVPSNDWFKKHDDYLLSKGITLNSYQKLFSKHGHELEFINEVCN